MRDDAPAPCEPLAGEMLADGDEIRKAVALLGKLAVLIPAPAFLRAAAYMGDRIDEAAIDERQSVGGESGGHRDAIGPIAIKEAGRGAVQRQIAAVEEGNGHRLAIGGRRQQAARHVASRIMTGGDLLAFAHGARARRHVVVIGLGRRRHRGIGETQQVCRKLEARVHAERISLLCEVYGMLRAVGERPHHDARQPVLALEPDEPVGKHRDRQDHPPIAMRHDLAPGLAPRRGQGRSDDLEVLGPVAVGEDDEAGYAVKNRMVLGLVANPHFARRHQAGSGVGRAEVDKAYLGGLVIMDRDRGERSRLRLAKRDEHACIRLLMDENVVADGIAEPVPVDPRRPMIVIDPDVEERPSVGAPHDRAAGVGNDVGKGVALLRIEHADIVEFGPLVVGAPGDQTVIGGMAGVTELEIGLVPGERVAVEQDRLAASAARSAAVQPVLSPVPESDIVVEGAVRRRNARIGLA